MKKFLSIAFIAASLVACNGGSKEEAPATDSTAVAPAADSTVKVDTAAVKVDSAAVKVDTAAKK